MLKKIAKYCRILVSKESEDMLMNKKWIILICFIIFVIVIFFAGSKFFSKKNEQARDYELLKVSEYNYYPLKVNGKYGVIKKDGAVIIEPMYDEVQIPNQDNDIFILKENGFYKVFNERKERIFTNFGEVSAIQGTDSLGDSVFNSTVLKYCENNKYGILDFEGKKITEAIYDEMSSLTDKYGEILIKENGKYGVLNVKGVYLVHSKYDYIKGDAYFINENYKNSGYIVGKRTNQGMRYGYIDKNEKEILKLEQESLYRVTEINLDDVYLVASQNGRYALYKNNNNLTGYKYIDVFYNNGTNSFTVQKNKSYGLINVSGEIVIPEEYEELIVVGIYAKAHKGDKDYTYDLNGNLVENSKFVSLQETTTGKFYISIDEDYKYGIADKEKNVVIENEYDYIDEIQSTGLLIATSGKNITIYSAGAKEIVSVKNANLEMVGDYIEVTTSDEFYYLSKDGKKVNNKTVYIENNIYASKSGKKWGFVDLKDNSVIPYIYDEVTEINEFGFAGIKKNGKWGVINKDAEVILEPTYVSDFVKPTFIGKYCKNGNLVTDTLD